MAYGYAMSGTTLAACAVPTIVTTTLFSTTSIFTGARYQHITFISTPTPTITVNVGVRIEAYGNNALYTASPVAVSTSNIGGIPFTSSNT